jgi:NAD(P)-dependent dehydrogenase (short-subunit alcohol dehydrogenase family)
VRGVFLSMKYELRQMVAQGLRFGGEHGVRRGLGGRAGFSGYTATKAAEIGMTKSSALEAAPHKIRINAVCPGLAGTPMIATMDPNEEAMKSLIASHPLGRIASANEIADAVVWLCSDKAGFITGVALPIDGGYSAPVALARREQVRIGRGTSSGGEQFGCDTRTLIGMCGWAHLDACALSAA